MGISGRNRGFSPIFIALSALIWGSSAVSAGGAEPPDLANGQEMALRHCAGCHAVTKTGNSLHPAAPPFRTFSRRWPIETLAEALAEGIVTGHPEMPTFSFSAAEVDDLLGWLESIQERRP